MDVAYNSEFLLSSFKLPPYTLAGFDLTTHDSASKDVTTRPRHQGMEEIRAFMGREIESHQVIGLLKKTYSTFLSEELTNYCLEICMFTW
jgi:hypothetical protein